MVDIHSHILYGLDDGAKTLEESVAMIQDAAGAGTTDIVATPHANVEFSYQPELVDQRIVELTSATGGAVRIHRGCDFHLSYDNIQDALTNPTKYTINQKTYLLVEFSDLLIFRSTAEIFERLRDAGMIPVVTHPERNQLLQQRLEQIAGWVADGCMVQVTAQSVVGEFGRRARDCCRELFERDLVHFVASDAHDCQRRPARLDVAYRHVVKEYGEPRAQRLFVKNPRAALQGEPLARSAPQLLLRPRRWYHPWR